MFMMQNNDQRLIKAAKRTFRAEFSLVLVILVITSWSVYALYKLTLDSSGTLFGLTSFSKAKPTNAAETSNSSVVRRSTYGSSPVSEVTESVAMLRQVQPNEVRLRILQELLADQQRERFRGRLIESNYPSDLLGGHRSSRVNGNQGQFGSSGLAESPPRQRMIDLRRPSGRAPILPSNLMPLIEPAGTPNDTSAISSLSPKAADLDDNSSESNSNNNEDYAAEADGDDVNAGDQENFEDSLQPDRQVSESSREPSESIIETTERPPEIMATDKKNYRPADDDDALPVQLDEADAGGDEGEAQQQKLQEEVSSLSKERTSGQDDDDDDGGGGSARGEKLPSFQGAKDERGAVDEALDHMIPQARAQPFDYNRDTVQFDDSLGGSGQLGSTIALSSRQVTARDLLSPGDRIANLARPKATRLANGTLVSNGTSGLIGANNQKEIGLLVDHNRLVASSGTEPSLKASSIKQQGITMEAIKSNKKKNSPTKSQIKSQVVMRRWRESGDKEGHVDLQSSKAKKNKLDAILLSNRQKRSFKKFDKIIAPYEIDDFGLNRLEVRASGVGAMVRRRRSAFKTNETSIVSGKENSPNVPKPPKYYYLTSNDTNLQELLEQKNLLEGLKQSQLPAPKEEDDDANKPGEKSVKQMVTRQPKSDETIVDRNIIKTAPAALSLANSDDDHQQVDSTISAAASGERKHKSVSMKKKKKHEKMKRKKKMSVGFKKGGHKKKKHKKEMKKYVKEKKFKGAKKGKKEAKGKGGQGGKKGKKLYKDKGFKKRGFKNVYHKEEFGQKKSYFDEYRDKDFKKKWKKFDDKYNYAQMKKWQAKDVKGAKKIKDHGEKYNKYDKSKWKKKYQKQFKEHSASSKKKKKSHEFR